MTLDDKMANRVTRHMIILNLCSVTICPCPSKLLSGLSWFSLQISSHKENCICVLPVVISCILPVVISCVLPVVISCVLPVVISCVLPVVISCILPVVISCVLPVVIS